MKVSRKMLFGCAFTLVVAFGILLPGSYAQSHSRGDFKLSFDAKMNTIPLPSGDYTFTIGRGVIDGTLLIYQGGRTVGMLRPEMLDRYDAKFEKTVFVFVRHDGTAALRGLRLPDVGTFYFPVPKEMKTLMAKQPQLIETVSVEVNGN